MNYIGTDIHISTLDFKVVGNLGKVKMARTVKTSAPNFLDFTPKRTKKIKLREATMRGAVGTSSL